MTSFLVLQLVFNVLMLVALVVLSRNLGRGRSSRPARGEASPSPSRGRKAPLEKLATLAAETAARRSRSAPPSSTEERAAPAPATEAPPLDDLVRDANQVELAAEQELRERLSRFRAQVAS
jgi:hypothetical protein